MNTYATFPQTVELAGERVRLRPWRIDDAPALTAAAQESLASVGRWLPWCHANYGLDDAKDWIDRCQSAWHDGEFFAFPVFEACSGQLVGSAGLNQLAPAHRSANLGYWIRQTRQGQGFAAQAARLAARFGFEQLGLLRVEIIVRPDNRASCRTAEKSGALFEGVARKRIWMAGQAHDAAVYSLVAEDLH